MELLRYKYRANDFAMRWINADRRIAELPELENSVFEASMHKKTFDDSVNTNWITLYQNGERVWECNAYFFEAQFMETT